QGSVGRFPTLLGTLLGLLRKRSERKCPTRLSRTRGRVDWLTGCGLLVHRHCLTGLGGFDPTFFLYYEDVDFCRRARVAGWSACYEPELHLVHRRPLHTREVPPRLRLLTRHALMAYAHRHWPAWQFRSLVALVWLDAHWRAWRARRAGRAGAGRV